MGAGSATCELMAHSAEAGRRGDQGLCAYVNYTVEMGMKCVRWVSSLEVRRSVARSRGAGPGEVCGMFPFVLTKSAVQPLGRRVTRVAARWPEACRGAADADWPGFRDLALAQ